MKMLSFVLEAPIFRKLGIALFLLNIYDVGATFYGLSTGYLTELNPLPLNIYLKVGLTVLAVLLNLAVIKGLLDSSSRFYKYSKHDRWFGFLWLVILSFVTAFYVGVLLINYGNLVHLGNLAH